MTLDKTSHRLQSVVANRKRLGLSPTDLTVLLFLVSLSRFRAVIHTTTATLAEKLAIHEKAMYRTLQKLSDAKYIKRMKLNDSSVIIVDPTIINSGNSKKQAFKIKLWTGAQTRMMREESHS